MAFYATCAKLFSNRTAVNVAWIGTHMAAMTIGTAVGWQFYNFGHYGDDVTPLTCLALAPLVLETYPVWICYVSGIYLGSRNPKIDLIFER